MLGQWLHVVINHPAFDPNLEMSVTGTGVNKTFSGTYAAVTNPSQLSVNGPTAYWDDIKVVSGAVIPEPTTLSLVVLGLIALGFRRRAS